MDKLKDKAIKKRLDSLAEDLIGVKSWAGMKKSDDYYIVVFTKE